jgi:hypothetical protein
MDPRIFPDGPFVMKTGRTYVQPLFHSDESKATLFDVMLAPGYGDLPAGTVLAKNVSTAGNTGKFVPFAPASYTGIATNPWLRMGRAFLLADTAATSTTSVTVSIADSYKFVVGDELILEDSDASSAEELGAITAITRGVAFATLTFSAVTPAVTNTAKYNNVHVNCGTSTPWMTAVCILSRDRATGDGNIPSGVGIPAPAVFKHASLYTIAMGNIDSAAKTSLGISDFEQYSYF